MRITHKLIENAIIGELLRHLFYTFDKVEIEDAERGWEIHVSQKDGEEKGWVLLILGNGEDIISDYSVNLESIMEELNT